MSSVTGRAPRSRAVGLIGLLLAMGGPAWADDCPNMGNDSVEVWCVDQELRASDKRINEAYKALTGRVDDAARGRLRKQQRAWLKQRDRECGLDSTVADRERWFAALLADPRKAVCTVRFTRLRLGELELQLAALTDPQAPAAAGAVAPAGAIPIAPPPAAGEPIRPPFSQPLIPRAWDDSDYYEFYSRTLRKTGKWYFELRIDQAAIARRGDVALWAGFVGKGSGVGRLVNVRAGHVSAPVLRLGFALDLDEGWFYTHENGEWQRAAPGTTGGLPVTLGRDYIAELNSSTPMAEMVEAGLIVLNLGHQPFEYALPPGFRPVGDPAPAP